MCTGFCMMGAAAGAGASAGVRGRRWTAVSFDGSLLCLSCLALCVGLIRRDKQHVAHSSRAAAHERHRPKADRCKGMKNSSDWKTLVLPAAVILAGHSACVVRSSAAVIQCRGWPSSRRLCPFEENYNSATHSALTVAKWVGVESSNVECAYSKLTEWPSGQLSSLTDVRGFAADWPK